MPTKRRGRKKSKSGAIYTEEYGEQRATDLKNAKKKRKTERLVYVGGYFKALTGVKENETDEEAIARYRSKHRGDFANEDGSLIPLKYRK